MFVQLHGHIIKESEIIGIGPLLLKHNNDDALRALYSPRKLFYQIYLKNQSITIESEWFYVQGMEHSVIEENKRDLHAWKATYEVQREQIKESINRNSSWIKRLLGA